MTIAFKSDGVKWLVTMPYWDSSQSKGQAQKAPCAPPCASDSEKLRLCCASPLTNNKLNKRKRGGQPDQNGPDSAEEPLVELPPEIKTAPGWSRDQIEALYRSMKKHGGPSFDYNLLPVSPQAPLLLVAQRGATGSPAQP